MSGDDPSLDGQVMDHRPMSDEHDPAYPYGYPCGQQAQNQNPNAQGAVAAHQAIWNNPYGLMKPPVTLGQTDPPANIPIATIESEEQKRDRLWAAVVSASQGNG